MRIITICVGHSINIVSLEAELKRQELPCKRFGDLVYIVEDGRLDQRRCFYLKNGTIILWNIIKHESQPYINLAMPFCEQPLKQPLKDSYIYTYGQELRIKPHWYFNADILTLHEKDIELILSLTYVFSQSIKLRMHENQINSLIEKYTPIIHRQSKSGKIDISRSSASKITGEILEAKSLINLKGIFVYPPKFFWDHPGLEKYYSMLEQYMDIRKRHDILNSQLDILHDVFTMLTDYLQQKHSHFLEWLIIILIAIEIIFNVFNLHLY